jgi:hypothetical protein
MYFSVHGVPSLLQVVLIEDIILLCFNNNTLKNV